MVLTREEILKEVEKGRIVIEPFSEENLGPASYDFTLSNEFRIFKKLAHPVDVHEDSDYRDITEKIEVEDSLLILPGETVLGITVEKLTLPDDICAWIQGRSRFSRLGLMVHITAAFVHPGVSNRQVLEIFNAGTVGLKLYPGTKICQIVFQRCVGRARYTGIFNQQQL